MCTCRKNGRREEYGALPGSLSEEAADSGLPAGTLQRRGEPELPFTDHKTGETATETLTQRELVARLKQHIPEKFFKMVRYFGFLASRVCGEKLPQVYRALGMDKPEPVAKVCYAQMVKQFLSRDPFECVLCGGRMVYRRAIAGLNVEGLKKNARDISLLRYMPA